LQETHQLFLSEGGGPVYKRKSGNDLEVHTTIKGCERRGLTQRTRSEDSE